MNLGQMLAQTAERLPNKTAIIFRDQYDLCRLRQAREPGGERPDRARHPAGRPCRALIHNLPSLWRRTTAFSRRAHRLCR